MDRNKLIDMCQIATVKVSKYKSFRNVEWNDNELVQYNGVVYYLEKYVLWFDRYGNARHSVQLHALIANSITIARLDSINTL